MKKVALVGILSVLAFSTKAEDIDAVGTTAEESQESAGSYALTSSGVRVIVGVNQRFLKNSMSSYHSVNACAFDNSK
ncbi:MAG: hypothetical protein LBE95_02475, partial [Holosporaceae bacterium]|nr:hypothetical protein [Holosporaceae bacterium]